MQEQRLSSAPTKVKYTFNKGKAVLMTPAPYSSEIQESEMGSCHVPMEKSGDERVRICLCIGRMGSCKEPHEAPVANGVVQALSPSEASNGAQQRRRKIRLGWLLVKERIDVDHLPSSYICHVGQHAARKNIQPYRDVHIIDGGYKSLAIFIGATVLGT